MLDSLRQFFSRLAGNHRHHIERLHRVGRHPFAVPVIVFSSLLILTLLGLIIYALSGNSLASQGTDIVIINHDHQTQVVPSHEPTVGALLAKLHIAINEGDVVEPSLDTAIHQDDFRINIYRAAPVKIVDNGEVSVTFSAATTPRSVVAQAGKTTYPEDGLTEQPVDSFLREDAIGSVVTIDRSVPVTLDINGFASDTRTRARTVGAFLAEKHIELGRGGNVQPGRDTVLASGQTIRVTRDGTGIQSISQEIPMPVQIVQDGSLAYGTSATRQAGSAGRQVLTYRIVVQNGQVISKTLLETVVTTEAVTQIVAQGTNLSGIKGDMALAGISADQYQYADYIISHESGWCPTKWQGEVGTCPVYHGAPTSSYTGYGLCQATPGYKMASAGDDWATNPITQLKWCTGYANGRYGSWYNAYLHWLSHHNW